METLIEEARGGVERNERQLAQARSAAERYQILVSKASALFSEMETASARAAAQTRDLEIDARSAESASHAASARLLEGSDEGGTAGLVVAIDRVEQASRTLRTTSTGLVNFVGGVARISRQAALLSTNARIEAAHLGTGGRGFAIVANEVRSLSESTKKAVVDIGAIARELAESTQRAAGSTALALAASKSLAGAESEIAQIVTGIEARVAEFVQPVAAIASIADEQQRALPLVLERFSLVTAAAEAVATSARDASALELASTFDKARSRLRALNLRVEDTLAPESDDPLIAAIIETARGRTHAALGRTEAIAIAVHRFASAGASIARATLEAIVESAVAVARNSVLWRDIASKIDELRDALDASRAALGHSREAAKSLVDSAGLMRDFSTTLREQTASAIQTLGHSVQSLDRVREHVELVAGVVGEMSSALERANTILSLVDEISAETNLLALNAAIEAAHAGQAGLGFSVIANEIRKLADSTHAATAQVGETMSHIGSAGDDIRGGTQTSSALTRSVEERARAAEGAVRDLIARMNQALDRSLELGAVAQQEMRSFDGLIAEINAAINGIDHGITATSDLRRLDLADVSAQAFSLTASRELGIAAEKLRDLGFQLSAEMDAVFSDAIASGRVRPTDYRDTQYERIEGLRVGDLARLFDVSRVPPQGFDPPKFATRYDRFVDTAINAIIDRYMPMHPAIKAILAIDLNGFCVAHSSRHDWTGVPAADLERNRIKRFFDDPLSLRLARVGLGAGASELPGLTTYERFESAGCILHRSSPEARPWVIYTYARDTGVIYRALSLGLFAGDMRVGTVRIMYDPAVL